MEPLTRLLEDVNKRIEKTIKRKLKTKGVESEFRSDTVLKIKDDNLMFNLEGGRYLVELTEDELIDNEGYSYHLSCLNLENLCKVVESI